MPEVLVYGVNCGTCGRPMTVLVGGTLVCDSPKCPACGQRFHAPRLQVVPVDAWPEVEHAEEPGLQTRKSRRK